MAIYSGNVKSPNQPITHLESGARPPNNTASGLSLLRLSPGLAISTHWDCRLVMGTTVCWEPGRDHPHLAKPPTRHLSVTGEGVWGEDPQLITSVLSHPVPTRYTFQNSIYNAKRLHTWLRICLSTRWEQHRRGAQPLHSTAPGECQSFCSKQKANSANTRLLPLQTFGNK